MVRDHGNPRIAVLFSFKMVTVLYVFYIVRSVKMATVTSR